LREIRVSWDEQLRFLRAFRPIVDTWGLELEASKNGEAIEISPCPRVRKQKFETVAREEQRT